MKLSRKEREFDLLSYNISVPPDYDDKDLFSFKAGSKHFRNKIGFMGRHPKRVS